jgi:gas vesicle protein GvpG
MFLLDSLLIDGLKFVMEKLLQVAETELSDDKVLRERLLDAQMRLELGELSMEEFTEIEKDVFARLREIKGGHTGPLSMTSSDSAVSVEASVADELKNIATEPEADRGKPARARKAK